MREAEGYIKPVWTPGAATADFKPETIPVHSVSRGLDSVEQNREGP